MQEKRIRLQDALYGRSPRLLRVHQARQWRVSLEAADGRKVCCWIGWPSLAEAHQAAERIALKMASEGWERC